MSAPDWPLSHVNPETKQKCVLDSIEATSWPRVKREQQSEPVRFADSTRRRVLSTRIRTAFVTLLLRSNTISRGQQRHNDPRSSARAYGTQHPWTALRARKRRERACPAKTSLTVTGTSANGSHAATARSITSCAG